MRKRMNRAHPCPKQAANAYAVELVYRIKLLRLAFGFSQGELSFLLGHATNRVEAIEDFNGSTYTLKDLVTLAHIFECPAVRFLPQGQEAKRTLFIRASRKDINGKLFHEAWENTGDQTWELLWKLPERAVESQTPGTPAALVERTRSLIRSLISGGYFNNPWEPFEIFKACRCTIGNQIRPLTLKYVLLSFVTGETAGLLRILRNGDYLTWVRTSL